MKECESVWQCNVVFKMYAILSVYSGVIYTVSDKATDKELEQYATKEDLKHQSV